MEATSADILREDKTPNQNVFSVLISTVRFFLPESLGSENISPPATHSDNWRCQYCITHSDNWRCQCTTQSALEVSVHYSDNLRCRYTTARGNNLRCQYCTTHSDNWRCQYCPHLLQHDPMVTVIFLLKLKINLKKKARKRNCNIIMLINYDNRKF